MRRYLRALAAVLGGNAIYFVALEDRLPAWARHRPFHPDFGLLLDFLICVGLYLLLGRLDRAASRRDEHGGR
jgi:hypothetical protein